MTTRHGPLPFAQGNRQVVTCDGPEAPHGPSPTALGSRTSCATGNWLTGLFTFPTFFPRTTWYTPTGQPSARSDEGFPDVPSQLGSTWTAPGRSSPAARRPGAPNIPIPGGGLSGA